MFWYNTNWLIMQLNCERVAIGTHKAFAMPWAVCFNVAYPPPQSLKTTTYLKHNARSVRVDASCVCFFDLKGKAI